MDKISRLKNKKIAILGYGREGESCLNFFLKNGISPAVLDQDPKTGNRPGRQDTKATLIAGRDCFSHVGDFDLVFRSPGIKRLRGELVEAEKNGVEISSATKLFFELCPCPIVGVTGTKGKGTTAALIFQILKACGKEVYLGGNIGASPLDFADKLHQDSLVVLELSSFQLQDLTASPNIAVVLSIVPEHLDYHRNTEEYIAAKSNLVAHQESRDFAVLNADCEIARSFSAKTKARKFWFSDTAATEPGAFYSDGGLFLKLGQEEEKICEAEELQLLGRHNWQNVLAAVLAAALAGAPLDTIRKVVLDFSGLPHRLQYVGAVKKVQYYNDSLSTIPESAIAAVRSFNRPVVIILGGSEKKSDFSHLAQVIASENVRGVVLIGATAPHIEAELHKAGYKGRLVSGGNTMKEIVRIATKLACEGDVVLLSPACASFDMFKDYADRGNQFIAAVKKMS